MVSLSLWGVSLSGASSVSDGWSFYLPLSGGYIGKSCSLSLSLSISFLLEVVLSLVLSLVTLSLYLCLYVSLGRVMKWVWSLALSLGGGRSLSLTLSPSLFFWG